jgi:hypothetical protein
MSESLPAQMKVNEFMLGLADSLKQRKEVADSTAAAYIRILYGLNDKAPFKSVAFLKKTADIDAKIAPYAESTQKNLYSGITSVLSLFNEKPTYKKVYQYYYDKMMGKAKEMRDGVDTTQKTEKEKENWVDWDDVQKKRTELKEKVAGFAKQKALTPGQFETLLHSTLVALYTEVQPRRNQDYLDMYVVRGKTEGLPTDKNYLVLEGKDAKRFIFNKFKTSRTYGQQTVAVPPALAESLNVYLKHHPLNKGGKKAVEFKFLVSADGSPLGAVNTITRALNKVFGKKVGSSMLRHSFLSGKYGEVSKEQSEDSTAMAHSVEEQRRYIRREGSGVPQLQIHEMIQHVEG